VSVWKSCDIRGIYGGELTASFAQALGRAVGEHAAGGQVLVSGDVRPSTATLKLALIDGLVAAGAHVLDAGIVPTPAFYHAKRLLRVPTGVMVTASHNPPAYNGFKIELSDWPITEVELDGLRAAVERDSWTPTTPGTVVAVDALASYADDTVAAFGQLTRRRVVVDAGNGCMSVIGPQVLAALGLDVVRLFCSYDGTFPNRSPNPADASQLAELQKMVLTCDAELGLAFDGDGDRVAFVDGSGAWQPADRVFVLLVDRALRQRPGAAVVYDQKSSTIVPEAIAAAGGRAIRERSGFAHIKRRLLAEEATLAGEISGHYFYAALGGDDGLYAACDLLAELDYRGETLVQALAGVPTYPITPEIRVPADAAQARAVITELLTTFAGQHIDRTDGVRVEFADGWALARESVTEPVITLRFEAQTPSRLEAIQAAVRAASPTLQVIWRG